MVFRVVTWIITVIIGAVPALCENAPVDMVEGEVLHHELSNILHAGKVGFAPAPSALCVAHGKVGAACVGYFERAQPRSRVGGGGKPPPQPPLPPADPLGPEEYVSAPGTRRAKFSHALVWPLELGLQTPTLRGGDLSGPSRIRGGFFDFEVGGHDGAYKGGVRVILPFVGRTNGKLFDCQQSYNVLVLRAPGLEEG